MKVECNDFYKSKYLNYYKEKKFLGITIRKEGIYNDLFREYLGFNVPKNFTLINNVVYNNPEVILYFGNYFKSYFFDSYDEAKNFVDDITQLGRWQD